MTLVNRRVTLKERPTGLAGPEHFAMDEQPVRAPGEGEVLIETLLLSVDPAMRVWISENPGYVEPVLPGEAARGQRWALRRARAELAAILGLALR